MFEIKSEFEDGAASYATVEVGNITVDFTGVNFPGHRSVYITQPDTGCDDDIIWMEPSQVVELIRALQKGLELYDEYDNQNT